MRIRVTMPNGNQKNHRIKTWGDFRSFVERHHKHDKLVVEADDDGLHVRVQK